jgi:hypothetical protein
MSATEHSWKFWLKTSVAALLGVAVLGHFTITAAYVAPPSPLRMKLLPLFHSYLDPYFSQRWELFAPDPVTDTRLLMVSCRVHGTGGGTEETAYSNMTSPLREMKDRYRLTPADRIDRVQQGALHIMFEAPDALTKKILTVPEEGEDDELKHVRTLLDEDQVRKHERGLRVLTRAASAECDRLYGPGRTSDVRVRMALIKPPPFSERNHPPANPPADYTEFDWAPYEPVAPL